MIEDRLLTLVVACLALTGGCSRALSVVFDVPPGTPAPSTRSVVPDEVRTPRLQAVDRPAIEGTLDPDSARALLPRDAAGNIDWVAAKRDGVIRPRTHIPGTEIGDPRDFRLGFDFYFPGPAEAFDAYFPHSVHTEWLACQQCHPRIFKYRDTNIKMADVLQGQYCGECHGKVSFPPTSGCQRCHTGLPQSPPGDGALLGTLRLVRAATPETREDPTPAATDETDSDASESHPPGTGLQIMPSADRTIDRSGLPPAVFPHWVHRVRFTCKTCHMDLFEPEAGANAITMADISAGQACGACHNGTVAFDAGFGSCQRCHQPLTSGSP